MAVFPKSDQARPWKALVICPHAEMAGRIPSALHEVLADPPVVITEYPRSGGIAGLAAQKGMNICFLDVVSDYLQAQALISELAPTIPVVALMAQKDADLILRCLRRGACEFLAEMSGDAVRSVFEHLGRARAPVTHQPSGKIWCVIPGKPGCGASTLAVHLAIQARASGGAVLLVDTDPLAANAAFLLKLKPEFHLGDMMRDWKRMDEDLWGRLILSAWGIDVLAAPDDPGTVLQVGFQAAAELCAFWRDRYQTVVLDLADVRFAIDSGFTALADTLLLVTTNELAALQNTRRALICLDRANTDRARVRLVLNRYTPATGLKQEDVHKALSVAPFTTLCNDYDAIQTALLEGRPAQPGTRYTEGVHALCCQLQDNPVLSKRGSWLGSLLARK